MIVFIFTDESCESAILTRPIKDYLDDSSDIDVMFGYTSAVNELFSLVFRYLTQFNFSLSFDCSYQQIHYLRLESSSKHFSI